MRPPYLRQRSPDHVCVLGPHSRAPCAPRRPCGSALLLGAALHLVPLVPRRQVLAPRCRGLRGAPAIWARHCGPSTLAFWCHDAEAFCFHSVTCFHSHSAMRLRWVFVRVIVVGCLQCALRGGACQCWPRVFPGRRNPPSTSACGVRTAIALPLFAERSRLPALPKLLEPTLRIPNQMSGDPAHPSASGGFPPQKANTCIHPEV